MQLRRQSISSGRGAGAASRKGERSYHHGDLARALLTAAEEMIAERGVEAFSLRECARRAGVSHGAPAHHFGDAAGLLTALAAAGFDRLTAAQKLATSRERNPALRIMAIGLAYVAFALDHPALFRLMFHSGHIDRSDNRIQTAGQAAFGVYSETMQEATGWRTTVVQPKDAGRDGVLMHQWALVHGLATLLMEGRLDPGSGRNRRERLLEFARAALEVSGSTRAAPLGSRSQQQKKRRQRGTSPAIDGV